MPKEFQTPFRDYVCPEPDVRGDWGGSVDGDTSSGQGAMPKGTPGIIPEVTMPDVEGGPAPNSNPEITGISGGIPRRMDK